MSETDLTELRNRKVRISCDYVHAQSQRNDPLRQMVGVLHRFFPNVTKFEVRLQACNKEGKFWIGYWLKGCTMQLLFSAAYEK